MHQTWLKRVDDDDLSEMSATMAQLWINHDVHRRCLLISHSNLAQNSLKHVPHFSFLSSHSPDFIMQRWWWSRARIFACKQQQQSRFACEIFDETRFFLNEVVKNLNGFRCFIHVCVMRQLLPISVWICTSFSSFYSHRNVSTCAVDAVRRVWLRTIRKWREIEEVQTHVDQKIPIVCTRRIDGLPSTMMATNCCAN